MNKFLFFLAFLLFSTAFQLNAQNTRVPLQGCSDRSQNVFDPTQVAPLPDVTPPSLTCTHLLNNNVSSNGMAYVSTNDLVLSVQDDKTPAHLILLGLRVAGTGTGFPLDTLGHPISSLTFDCFHQGEFSIEVWAVDLSGNSTVCTTTITINDNYLNCAGENSLVACSFQGNCGVEEISMMIQGTDSLGMPISILSLDAQGCTKYSIPTGSNVEVMPTKDDNPLNGVTTFDWVLIKKHLEGIDTFTTPYQWIAADVNGDRVIDLQDSTDFYKLVLGIYTELPSNTSWRFVPKDYVFPWPNPLSQPYPQSITISNFSGPDTAQFVAIKIGDVNGTAVCNNASPELADDRGGKPNVLGSMAVFPNPTTSGVRMQYHATHKAGGQFELFDHSGKLLYNRQLSIESGTNNWDIPAETMSATGLFVWRLQIEGKYQTGKILRN